MLTAEKRARLTELRREVKALTSPDRKERNAALARARKARSAALKASEAPNKREERELDRGFLAYLRRQPCEAAHRGGCSGPIEAAHIRFNDGPGRQNPGAGRKNHDRHANPLCRFHHQHDQHARSERAFWRDLGKDAYDIAAAHYAAYQEIA